MMKKVSNKKSFNIRDHGHYSYPWGWCYPVQAVDMLKTCLHDDMVEMFGLQYSSRILDLLDRRL